MTAEVRSAIFSGATLVGMWECMWPIIVKMRKVRGDALYENFEYLAEVGKAWQAAHAGSGYPANMPCWKDLPTR